MAQAVGTRTIVEPYESALKMIALVVKERVTSARLYRKKFVDAGLGTCR